MRKKVALLLIVLLIVLVPTSIFANALLNPGFEQGYRNVDGVGELTVAEHWYPWYVEGPQYRPEYKPEQVGHGMGRVKAGLFAQKQFTTFSSQDGGIRQSVAVEPGEWYEFSAWVYVWCSSSDDPNVSVGGKCSALVGVNPWGDWNAPYRTTVWGKEALDVYNEWVQVKVVAQAWTDEIALFTRGVSEYPVKHSDFYFDSASFRKVTLSGECPTPEPIPCPTVQPGQMDYDRIRDIVREELRAIRVSIE